MLACNKENYSCSEAAGAGAESDEGGGGLGVARRPSISAPIKKSRDDPRCSTPIKADPDSPPRIKEELDMTCSPDEGPCKRSRTEVADAESNTTHSGRYRSVWTLL